MGTWGNKVFEDDFALDVRDAYLEKINTGMSSEDATTQLINEFGFALNTPDDGPVFWISLALTQWEYGRLVSKVKSMAIDMIESGKGGYRWENNKESTIELEKCKATLLKDQPAPKTLVNKKIDLKEGDIFRFVIFYELQGKRRRSYRYGRVIHNSYLAFYSHASSRFGSRSTSLSLKDILLLDVEFIVECHLDAFYDRHYEVIGNLPLEVKFKCPILFYHRSAGSDTCLVFNIWDPHNDYELHISELDPRIEQWGAYNHIHVLKRLRINNDK